MIKLNFNKKLLIGLTSIIFVVFSVLFLVFYNYYSKVSLDDEYVTLNHSTERTSSQIDLLFNQMSMSGLYISKNDFIHEILDDIFTKEDISEYEMIENSGKIRSQLNILTYYFPNTTNVTLFNAKYNFYFHSGLPDNKEEVSRHLEDLEWYNSLIPDKNQLKILPPHQDFWVTINRPVISIIRSIKSNNGYDYGLLEFDIPYWNLENICEGNNGNENTKVLIFNEDGDLIYPYIHSDSYEKIIKTYNPKALYPKLNNQSDLIKINNRRYIYSKHHSDFTNWTTVLISYPSTLIESQKIFRIFFFSFSLLILILVIIAFSLLIRRLTRPLYNLMTHVKEVSIDNMYLNLPNEGNNEIDLLNESFNIMFDNIKDSINQIYESKIREVNANLLALQAQMNPHFLYNTLSVISASSERNGISETTIICNKLSNMLRYVSNSKSTFVSLSEEIKHTIDYLDLMKTHYKDYNNPDNIYLDYDINLPDEMLLLKIPKMTLQPLVENSINHGFKDTMPPWHISITGKYISPNNWSLTIIDNGSGFEDKTLDKLYRKINDYKENLRKGHFQQNAEIGGMGIMNTYTRLAIHYKSTFTFELKNNVPNGAYIKLEIKHIGDD
ncbi:sensor histidine kinase [Vallitalea guaymasensis]|uniref:Histidine kinase n=1 Tax=Vallitalea guaymasensis TaxID=1185412 RepID=A0A8J8SDU7_9FIRM|nr:sensor histidine kinase [Vallitalea guaymasensis]QUH30836.1 histidine kinase [Vallitalea guaymasensis]